jgi:UDP-GlcNAc:undecaprenyl-phosphate/decaprenyl-phosphate GlcNAc-1-phosphate transferase
VLRLIGPAAASFSLCLLAIVALRPLAIAVDLIDRPGGRKTHHGDVPIVGGVAMFLGVVLGTGLLPLPDASGSSFLAACAVLVTIGLIDDRFDLSPWTRLPAQIAAALVLVAGSGALVTTLGDPFGTGMLNLTDFGAPVFTILITIAAINAFNMLDGMDGLAGAMALITLIALTYLAWSVGLVVAAGVSLVLAGAICAFLVFNFPTRLNRPLRCFMGDGGSTLLGFSVAWLCIQVSQGPVTAAAPVTTLWVVALPLYELVWSTVRRIVRGVSPFRADSDHFHHLLLKAGFGVRGAFAVFVLLAGVLAAFGVAAERYGLPDHYSFMLLIATGVGVIQLMYRADLLWRLIPESLRRLPSLESSPPGTPWKRH